MYYISIYIICIYIYIYIKIYRYRYISIYIDRYQFSDRQEEDKLECKYNFWHRDHVNPNRLKLVDDFPSLDLHIKRTKQFNTFAD